MRGAIAATIKISGSEAAAPALGFELASGGDSSSRAAPGWIQPVRTLELWLSHAKRGDRLIYGQGPQLIRGDTADLLRNLAQLGHVALFQPRSTGRSGFDFIVEKRVARLSSAELQRVRGRRPALAKSSAPYDDATILILAKLNRAAKKGERCPSNAELGRISSLSVPQVKWRMRKLTEDGKIRTRLVDCGPERIRVVTILVSGLTTAVPSRCEPRS
jgi:hypothetical protein